MTPRQAIHVCAALALAGFASQLVACDREVSSPELHAPSSVTLESVAVLAAHPVTVTLRNVSDKELRVSAVETTCGCTGLPPGPLVIPPDGSREIDIEYLAPREPGDFQVNISFEADGVTLATTTLHARVIPPLPESIKRSEPLNLPIADCYEGRIESVVVYPSARSDEPLESRVDEPARHIVVSGGALIDELDLVITLSPSGERISQRVRVVEVLPKGDFE